MTAPVHLFVKCDGCNMKSINGLRFKCGNCKNYNLCGICVNYEQLHDNAHVFLLIKQPLSQDLNSAPLLKNTLYPSVKLMSPWDFPSLQQDDCDQKHMSSLRITTKPPTEQLPCFPSQQDDCDQKQANIFRMTTKPPIFGGVTPAEKRPDAPLGNSFTF